MRQPYLGLLVFGTAAAAGEVVGACRSAANASAPIIPRETAEKDHKRLSRIAVGGRLRSRPLVVRRDNPGTDEPRAPNASQSSRAGSRAAHGCFWAKAEAAGSLLDRQS